MKVCHYLPGDMGEGGYPEIVTNGDMGVGGDLKLPFLRWRPFWTASYTYEIHKKEFYTTFKSRYYFQ